MRNHEVAWAAAEALEAMEKARRAKEQIAAEMRARGLELLPVEGHPTRRAWQRLPGQTPPPAPAKPQAKAFEAPARHAEDRSDIHTRLDEAWRAVKRGDAHMAARALYDAHFTSRFGEAPRLYGPWVAQIEDGIRHHGGAVWPTHQADDPYTPSDAGPIWHDIRKMTDPAAINRRLTVASGDDLAWIGQQAGVASGLPRSQLIAAIVDRLTKPASPTPPPSLPESLAEQAQQDLAEQRQREVGGTHDRLLSDLVSAVRADPAFARKVIEAVRGAIPQKQPREEPVDPEHDALVETWEKRLKDSMGDEAAYHQIRRELADLSTRTLKALQRRAGRKRWSSRKDAIKFLVYHHEGLMGQRARQASRDGRTAA